MTNTKSGLTPTPVELGIDTNIKKFGYAPITDAGFGSPVIYDKNIVSASSNVEQGTTKVRGDGQVKMAIKGPKNRSLEITLLKVDKNYAALALGFKVMDNGGVTDTGINSPHAVFYMTEEVNESGKVTDVLHYFYNVTAGTPSEEHAQNEDEVTIANLVIPYEAIPSDLAKDKDGVPSAYFKLEKSEANKTLFESYISKIIKPSDTLSGA